MDEQYSDYKSVFKTIVQKLVVMCKADGMKMEFNGNGSNAPRVNSWFGKT